MALLSGEPTGAGSKSSTYPSSSRVNGLTTRRVTGCSSGNRKFGKAAPKAGRVPRMNAHGNQSTQAIRPTLDEYHQRGAAQWSQTVRKVASLRGRI